MLTGIRREKSKVKETKENHLFVDLYTSGDVLVFEKSIYKELVG